jgi:pimeloyl-ACP methyl ester carboxylesterase
VNWPLRILCTLMILGASSSVLLASCPQALTPSSMGRSQWYCENGSDAVVIFVHGLHSNNIIGWLHESPQSRTFWPDLVLKEPAGPNDSNPPSVFLASYFTSLSSGHFSMVDAQEEIFQSLVARSGTGQVVLQKKTIIFVAHSLGGVLVRDLLARHADAFAGKRIALMLVASPSKGSSFANIARFLQWTIGNNRLVEQLETGSQYLEDVHRRFSKAIAPDGPLKGIVGQEIYEHLGMLESELRCPTSPSILRDYLCAARQTVRAAISGGPIVPADSAAIYWPDNKRLIALSNHSTIARPTDSGHWSHIWLRDLIGRARAATFDPCRPPPNFKLLINLKPRDPPTGLSTTIGHADYQLIQLGSTTGQSVRPELPLSRDDISGLYSILLSDPPFPCRGEAFWAKITRVAKTSVRLPNAALLTTNVCFRRSSTGDSAVAPLLQCSEGISCAVDKEAPSLADDCTPDNWMDKILTAGKTNDIGNFGEHWEVPSLETLESLNVAQRPGFAEFHIVSEPLSNLVDATHLTFGITVNGVPLHISGQPPFSERHPVSRGGRVHLTFAVENLGFKGGVEGDGFESVKVEMRFFRDEQAIGVARLERQYVAYRHGELKRETDHETGETFEWLAYYRPAGTGRNYEVVFEHSHDPGWIRDRLAILDSMRKSALGLPVVGVVRPGRRENPRIGITIGLAEPTGQIRSLFTRSEAEEVCRWVMRQDEFIGMRQSGSYIFEFPLETFSNESDRGRRVAYCRDM